MTGDAKRFVSLGEMSVSSWPLFGFVPGAGAPNRKWRRKRLKSLDSDSGMVGPIGRLTPNIWVPKNDAALRFSGYRQSALALAVHAPKPLAIMLRMRYGLTIAGEERGNRSIAPPQDEGFGVSRLKSPASPRQTGSSRPSRPTAAMPS
jgi:hypothetical protein